MSEDEKKVPDEKQGSMKRRMIGNDYTARNIYMITMAVEGRQPLLGSLDGRLDAPAGSAEAPWVRLSPLGQRVAQEVEHIGSYYPQVRVLGKQVMPDHLHFILYVTEQLPVPLGRVINGFKTGCRRAWREVMGGAPQSGCPRDTGAPQSAGERDTGAPQSGCPRDTRHGEARAAGGGDGSGGDGGGERGRAGVVWPAALQPGQKGQPGQTGQPGQPAAPRSAEGVLWEKGYNDRVLYGQGQLNAMIAYIHDNPRRLMVRRSRTAFFRHDTVSVGGRSLYAFGNVGLLDHGCRVAVRCSRRLTLAEQQRVCAAYMERGAAGAVLVSPFISPGERLVLTAALERGLQLIMIQDNGFAPYYKPYGRLFDACAAGRLLLLSPFSYHTEKVALTRDTCNLMNTIATQLGT